MTNELYHIGMPRRSGRYPWGSGKRPHQSLEKPKKVSDMSDQELTDYIKRKNLEKQYGKLSNNDTSKLETARDIANESANAVNRAYNISRSNNNNQQKNYERMDLSNMTDQQLRDAINRENLEIQYSKLFNSYAPEVSKGKAYTEKALSIAGDLLMVTGSSLGIAVSILKLMGKLKG